VRLIAFCMIYFAHFVIVCCFVNCVLIMGFCECCLYSSDVVIHRQIDIFASV
jgi:hypothetical protein